jgi:hypothetical protein
MAAARGVVLTGEAVGAATTDGVNGGNGSQVGEGAPSPAPLLHTSTEVIRQGIAHDEEHGEGSSQAMAEVSRVICGGRRRSWPVMLKPRAKEGQRSED